MSIVVGVRVRPFNQREKQRESQCCIDMPGGNQTKIFDLNFLEKYIQKYPPIHLLYFFYF